jgi:hypothetical protein
MQKNVKSVFPVAYSCYTTTVHVIHTYIIHTEPVTNQSDLHGKFMAIALAECGCHTSE